MFDSPLLADAEVLDAPDQAAGYLARWEPDERTADQRRADALVDLAATVLHDPHLPTAQGLRPTGQVTVALSTLLGVDEQPGELAGHGPIPASVARRIAADPTGTWHRLVTTRDSTCTFTGCARNARSCDLPLPPPPRQTRRGLDSQTKPRHRRIDLAKPRRPRIPVTTRPAPADTTSDPDPPPY